MKNNVINPASMIATIIPKIIIKVSLARFSILLLVSRVYDSMSSICIPIAITQSKSL